MNMIRRMLFVLSVLALGGLASPAVAVDTPPPAAAATFGVLDMNKILKVTEVAKDIFSQLESKRKEYQVSIGKEEEALRAAEQEILKQKDSLSKDDFEKKRKEFEEKVLGGQKLVQERKRILDQAFNSSMGGLRNEAAKIVAEIAKEKNYSAVFTQDAVMISAPNLDMTDIVIEKMDKTVKKMPIDWAAMAPPSDVPAKGGKKK